MVLGKDARTRVRHAYVIATIGAGAAFVAYAASVSTAAALGAFALFAAASAAAEYFQVDGADDGLDPADARTFSFSSGIHFAAIVVAGPFVAAPAAAFGVLLTDRVRGHRWERIAFNAGVFVLSTAAGAYAFQLAGGTWGELSLPGDLVSVAAMAAGYAVLNTVLVAIVLALSDGAPVVSTVRDALRFDLDSDISEAGIGALLAFVLLTEPWAIVMLLPLAFAAYQAHARLTLVRRETAQALETFANVVDERDPYTFRHSDRVASYVHDLAEALGLPSGEVARLRWAGRLHDLGKVAVDASVLRRPGPLDDGEWTIMRRHPRLSSRILRRFHLADEQARAVEFHHERFDGDGYYGVAAKHVPLASHFIVVADTFDAMTTDRPYRRALSEEEALAELERGAGTQFHPLVARAFVSQRRGEDPAAALTRAERAELARVFHRRSSRRFDVRRPSPDTVFLVGACVAVGALGLGPIGWPVAAGAAVVAVTAAARLRAGTRAARALRERVADADFLGLVDVLTAETELSWAGLLRWDDAQLAGSIAREWNGLGARPNDVALTSWLVREADARHRPLEIAGAELGTSGRFLAARIVGPDGEIAVLVLGFAERVPYRVRELFADLPERLESALNAQTLPAPALRAAS